MGVYYDYYLEKKDEDGWHRLNALEEGNDASIYYHSGSYGCDYVLDYLMSEFSILTVREYDNERSDYDELGKLTMQTRKVVYSTIETAYENTHSKELTK